MNYLKTLPFPASNRTSWPWTKETSVVKTISHQTIFLPKISIITPSYNQGAFIEETIRSVLLQNYPNIEFIIIDGGSKDNTVEIIKKYDSWITYWESVNDDGQADALNKGFSRATGDIICWLNSDDTLEPDVFFQITKAMHESNAKIVMARHFNFIDEDSNLLKRNSTFYTNRKRLIRYWHDGGMSINQPSVFFKSELLLNLRSPYLNTRLKYAMDYDLWLKLTLQADIMVIPGCWANYRIHPSNKTSVGFKHFIPEWNYVSKTNWGKWYDFERYKTAIDLFITTIKNSEKQEPFIPKPAAIRNSYAVITNKVSPKISVIITNYNYAQYLNECIESVLKQRYRNKEIIVIDDGSTDNSDTILDSYNDEILVIKQQNKGQSAAFNTGFKACSGEIICFLDADDYWQTNKLDEIVKKFREMKYGLIFHDLDIIKNGKLKGCYSDVKGMQLIQGNIYPEYLEKDFKISFIPTSGLSITRRIAKIIFPLDEVGWEICADMQIIFACLCLAPVGCIDKILGTYRVHDSNSYYCEDDSKQIDTEVTYIANKALCSLKIGKICKDTSTTLLEPFDNYLFYRRWVFMSAKIDSKLLYSLLIKNLTYFKKNQDINYKYFSMFKFIILDLIICLNLKYNVPSKRLKRRKLYQSKFAENYNEIFSKHNVVS